VSTLPLDADKAVAAPAVTARPPSLTGPIRIGLALFSTIALIVIVGFPVLAIVLYAIFPNINEGSFTAPFSEFFPNFARPDLIGATINSIVMASSVVAVSAVIAVPMAFLRSRVGVVAGRIWDAAFLIPFLVPPYIGALAGMMLLQRNGYVERILGFNLDGFLYSFADLVAVMALNLFPLMYFATSRVFAMIGRRYGDVAKVFGASFGRAFFRIYVPLCLPALLSSGLLVFVLTIEEFGTPAILGTRFGFEVIVTAIHDKVSDWPIDLAGASTLSFLLIVIAFFAFIAHERMSKRVAVEVETASLGQSSDKLPPVLAVLTQAAFGVVFFLAIFLPVASIIIAAFTARLSGGLALENFTFANIAHLVDTDGAAIRAIGTSLSLAIGAAVVTGIIGLVTAFVLVRMKIRGAGALDFLALLPNSVPGMAVAVGLILAWNQAFWPVTPYNTVLILLVAYSCLMLPYPIRMISTALKQIPKSVDEAAYISGANELSVIWRVVLPIVAPSALAAGFIVFAISTRELVTSIMLAPPGVETVSTYVFNQFDQGSVNSGMAMSLLAIAASAIVIAVGQGAQGRK